MRKDQFPYLTLFSDTTRRRPAQTCSPCFLLLCLFPRTCCPPLPPTHVEHTQSRHWLAEISQHFLITIHGALFPLVSLQRPVLVCSPPCLLVCFLRDQSESWLVLHPCRNPAPLCAHNINIIFFIINFVFMLENRRKDK